MDECLNRFFNGVKPLKAKWQARWHPDYSHVMVLFHYHHRVLVYDTENRKILEEWWELPTDKRGLDAAKEYLKNKHQEENV
jgi:hypothetical protein